MRRSNLLIHFPEEEFKAMNNENGRNPSGNVSEFVKRPL
jgi:hypothetical protein